MYDLLAYDTEPNGDAGTLVAMAIFVLQLRFRPEHNERRLEVRPRHREHLTSLREQGKLISAGPFADDTGALLLYDVATEADVREILANDPYPEEVYEIALLQEWNPLFPLAP